MTANPRSDRDEAFARFRDAGDPSSLATVYALVAPELRQLARRLAPSGSDAEDAVQATFVTAIEGAHTWDSARPVDRWLRGILVNHLRAIGRRSRRVIDPARLSVPFVERVTPEARASHSELSATFEDELGRLPPAWRAPLRLRVEQGLTMPEIARKLDRPQGTVRSQLARAFSVVRGKLAHALSVLWGPIDFRRSVSSEHPLRSGALEFGGGASSTALGGVVVAKLVCAMFLAVAILGFALALMDDEVEPGKRIALIGPAAIPRGVVEMLAVNRGSTAVRVPAPDGAIGDRQVAHASRGAHSEADGHTVVSVQALDSNGNPVPGATVTIEDPAQFGESNVGKRLAAESVKVRTPPPAEGVGGNQPRGLTAHDTPLGHTDGNGVATFVLPTPRSMFSVQHEAVGRSHVMAGSVSSCPDNPMRVFLLRPITLHIDVVDASQSPAVGIAVSVTRDSLIGTADITKYVSSSPRHGIAAITGETVTDAYGRVTVHLDAGRSYNINATCDVTKRRTRNEVIDADPGEVLTSRLVLHDVLTMHGVVSDEHGEPVPDARVQAWFRDPLDARDKGLSAPRRTENIVRTDDRGAYAMSMWSPGDFIVVASSSDVGRSRRSVPAFISFDEQNQTGVIDLSFEPETQISGRVVDADGEPIAGVAIVADPLHSGKLGEGLSYGRDVPSSRLLWGRRKVTTAEDGGFVLDRLVALGRYDVEVVESVVPTARREGVDGSAKDLTLVHHVPGTARWTLVPRAFDGAPIKWVLASITTRGGVGPSTTTVDRFKVREGTVVLDGIELGAEVALTMTPLLTRAFRDDVSGLGGDAIPNVVPGLASVDLPWTRVVGKETHHVTFTPSGGVVVECVDDDGGPWSHLRVELDGVEDDGRGRAHFVAITNDHGFAPFSDVTPGHYRVTTIAFGRSELASELVTVMAGGIVKVQLQLPRAESAWNTMYR